MLAMSRALIIFVRNPEKGKVKTRLAATLGADHALEIYRELLAHTAAITSALTGVSKYIFYAGSIAEHNTWNNDLYLKMPQADGDLGEKMEAAFKEVFSRGHTEVAIIGSDCPGLTTEALLLAFKSLGTSDVVIGPANDGGYYLLGMKAHFKEFFQQKQWSTPGVYEATLGDARRLKLSYHSLPELIDIDTEEDWRLARQLKLLQ